MKIIPASIEFAKTWNATPTQVKDPVREFLNARKNLNRVDREKRKGPLQILLDMHAQNKICIPDSVIGFKLFNLCNIFSLEGGKTNFKLILGIRDFSKEAQIMILQALKFIQAIPMEDKIKREFEIPKANYKLLNFIKYVHFMEIHKQNFDKFSYKQLEKVSKGKRTPDEVIFLKVFFYYYAQAIHRIDRFNQVFLINTSTKQKYRFSSIEYASFKNHAYRKLLVLEKLYSEEDRDLFFNHIKTKPNLLVEQYLGTLNFDFSDEDFLARTQNYYRELFPDAAVSTDMYNRFSEYEELIKEKVKPTEITYDTIKTRLEMKNKPSRLDRGPYRRAKELKEKAEKGDEKDNDVYNSYKTMYNFFDQIDEVIRRSREIEIKDFGPIRLYQISHFYCRAAVNKELEDIPEDFIPYELNDLPNNIYFQGQRVTNSAYFDRYFTEWRDYFRVNEKSKYKIINNKWEEVGESTPIFANNEKIIDENEKKRCEELRKKLFAKIQANKSDDLIQNEIIIKKCKDEILVEFLAPKKIDYNTYEVHNKELVYDMTEWGATASYKDNFEPTINANLLDEINEQFEEICLGL